LFFWPSWLKVLAANGAVHDQTDSAYGYGD